MASELNALDEPEVEKFILPKFCTWNERDGAGVTRFGYWLIEVVCEEEGLQLGVGMVENGLCDVMSCGMTNLRSGFSWETFQVGECQCEFAT